MIKLRCDTFSLCVLVLPHSGSSLTSVLKSCYCQCSSEIRHEIDCVTIHINMSVMVVVMVMMLKILAHTNWC